MEENFEALRSDVDAAREYLYEDDPKPYISFVEDYFEIFDSFFMKALDALDEICAEEGVRPEDSVDKVKNGAYQGLQRVRQIRSALHSSALPIELYYLLEDIKDDLEIDTVIGLDPGSNPDRKFLIEKMDDRFRILKGIVFWTVWEGEAAESRVINLPRSELSQPLSYSLLAHECFHVKDDLIDQIKTKLDELDVEFEDDHTTEIAVDLLSLNYMGPVYAERLLRIPDKIGEHKSDSYPDQSDRIAYSTQYIEWLIMERGYDAANVPIQRRLDSQEYTSKFRELEEFVRDKLVSHRRGSSNMIPGEDFNELQEHIRGVMTGRGIPTYAQERESIFDYMGMPQATTQMLSEKLDKFLLYSEPGKEVALPVKPSLLLNLLLLMEDVENRDLQEVILLSFKKWYVTSRTLETAS